MLTGGVSYPRRHTPSTAKAVPLPLRGGKGLSFIVVGIPVIIARRPKADVAISWQAV